MEERISLSPIVRQPYCSLLASALPLLLTVCVVLMQKLVSTLCAYAYYAHVFIVCVCVCYSRAAVKAATQWAPIAHKGNWSENTWASHQGPTLAVISPRGTICKMNTLIKTAMCAHRCVYLCTNQFRDSVNMAAKILAFESE